MASVVCGIELDFEIVDFVGTSDTLNAANPIGKVPVLILPNGEAVFDSSVICEVFDRMSGNQLIPQTLDGFRRIRTFDAAVTGVTDALALCIYEVRYRPDDKRHPDWTDRQMGKADRGLRWLEEHLVDLGESVGLGHCGLAALIGWMDLRFEGKAAKDAPKLVEWADEFFSDHPNIAAMKPFLP
ncbi:Aminoacyl-tRNA synthetase, class I:Glutathione S-transferase, N-terminal [Fulvimarina pelagi HTCC2506]|uniref:Aminoacyl-tRNA synthetase, class I:Glutathione S-transferase, N-terminal n=2 Tax=Fulvimarina pelagi TaxID=217511 RepID=Q0G6E7_9HYPH|nr:Aminoacyl-tRNA synthetase, class I:Glutathione S-transferase, N-terminal [Fulvimarina pelagi HTCC2506]